MFKRPSDEARYHGKKCRGECIETGCRREASDTSFRCEPHRLLAKWRAKERWDSGKKQKEASSERERVG